MSFRFFRRRVATPGLLGLALLAVVLLAALGGGDSEVSANQGDRGIARAIAAQEAHTDALLARAGVAGTAVGMDENGDAIVLILTDRRGVRGLPSSLNGVTAAVHFTGTISA